ncbi:MAG: cytochrome b6-f complex iron-sulfur subunit [Acidimicrobiaceae bacterium]|jgi:cytochrome b6-f complex iron-sulfur subunit
MSNAAIIGIGIVVLVLLAVVLLAGAARRRDTGEAVGGLSRETRKRDKGTGKAAVITEPPLAGRDVEKAAAIERREPSKEVVKASAGELSPWVPPDPETFGATRRQFLNRGIVTLMSLSLGTFGLSLIGFLWPSSAGGFGGKVRVGKVSDIKAVITAGKGFGYFPEARMWVTEYPSSALEKAKKVTAYTPPVIAGMEAGFVFLYQKCVHLGCRVPNCTTSQWFECPCHGSQYNRVGEKKGGPAPRGLDRFTPEIVGDVISVNTSTSGIIQGPPIGTNTTGQEAEGPHCVGGGGHKA